MKNLILCIVTIFMFNSNGFSQSDKFNELHEKYILSESYKNFNQTFNLFYDKLNYDVNLGLNELKSIQDFEVWIETNKNKISFSSIDDLKIEFTSLGTLFNKMVEENNEYFALIPSEDFYKLSETNFKVKLKVPSKMAPCSFGCINDAVGCNSDADSNYAAAIGASGVGFFFNVVVAGAGAVVATIVHHNAVGACVRGFNSCMRKCGYSDY
ncbi:hypothetical protein [Flavobacterium sp.]|uniref:hypothetical protein n=1 Tax=Flavobacterium sp. TaxID=239 RepID=UPI0037502595